MKLALAVGRVDVDGLASEISGQQLNEWMAYDRIEPFGGDRADIHAALIQHTMYLLKSGGKAKLTAADFLPAFKRPAKLRETPEQMSRRIRAGFAKVIATIKRGSNERAS